MSLIHKVIAVILSYQRNNVSIHYAKSHQDKG